MSQNRRNAAALGLLLAAAVPATLRAAPAVEGPTADLAEEADLQFNLGVELYRQGQLQSALEHLLASNRLAPNRNVVFNIARIYEQLGRLPEAYRHYADFARDETEAAARGEAERALARLAPRVALLSVESTPPGATFFLDRRDLGARGRTPAVLAVSPGAHTVFLELGGHEAVEAEPVEAVVGQSAAVVARLEPILGRLLVRGAPAGAEIRLDSVDAAPVGRLPAELDVPPGPHTIYITAPGRRSAQLGVQVAAKATASVEAELAPLTGSLVLDADEPAARIEIDGVVAGFTPTVLDTVPVGRHRIRISVPGYAPFEREVEVAADARLTLQADLLPQSRVTAAARTAQALDEAPASVTLVTRDELRAFGAETLAEALGGLRGVYLTNDRTYVALGIRGFSRPGDYGNRMLVQLDGHAMNDDLLGSSYVAQDFQTDLGAVQRIELVRGPGSALYGSNAFFGVVNVVTDDLDSLPRPQASLASSGPGHLRLRLAGGTSLGERSGVFASVSGARATGEDLSLPTPNGGATQSRGADGFTSLTAQGKAFWRDLTLQGNFNRRNKEIPTGAFGTLLADDRAHSIDERAFVELRYEPGFGGTPAEPKVGLSTRLWLDRYAFDGDYPYAPPPGDVGLQRDRYTGLAGGGEARASVRVVQPLRLTVGAEGRVGLKAKLQSRNDETWILQEDAPFQVYSGYAVADFDPLAALGFSLGLRLDHYSTFGNTLSPRLATLLRPSSADVIKLIAGQAFRAPSTYEQVYNDDGRTQVAAGVLQPETVRTLEAEYTRHLTAELSLTTDVFYNQIANLVELGSRPVSTPPATCSEPCTLLRYDNAERRLTTLGAELELARTWRRGGMLSASYAWQRTGTAAFEQITNSPEHLVSLRHAVPLGRSGATLANAVRGESGRKMGTGGSTSAIFLWDLTVTGDVVPGHLSYGLGARNLTDARYGHPASEELFPVREVPQPRRSFFATLTATY